jgi:hypothetical protein
MKIRIKGNSIRLRLTKSDIELLGTKGIVEEKTNFPESVLTYQLINDNGISETEAHFGNNTISVHLPSPLSNLLCNSDAVGYENHQSLSNGQKLYILVEKDFKCLDNTLEDQSDNYEHPTKRC